MFLEQELDDFNVQNYSHSQIIEGFQYNYYEGCCCTVSKKNNITYYKNGLYHRKLGPAIIENGNEYWYLNGQLHRKDGPAVELTNGRKEWWIEGKPIKIEEN